MKVSNSKKAWPYFISLCAGILLTLSFAPFYLWYLAPASLALALYTWQQASQGQAFWRGFFYGLGFFSTSIYWIAISIYRYGGADLVLAGLITGGFIMVLSLLPAFQAVLYTAFYRKHLLYTWLFLPIAWVICEWIRANAFTGFPWILLGVSQVPSPLAGYASLGNIYLASFMTALIASLIFSFFMPRSLGTKITTLFLLILIYTVGALGLKFAAPTSKPLALTFALVQGNVPQELKWDPTTTGWIRHHYENLSRSSIGKVDVIIWPEGALASLWPWNQQALAPFIKTLAEHHTTLIFGSPATKDGNYYNAMIVEGAEPQVYFKRHLVPLGEYIPFPGLLVPIFKWFNFPVDSFTPGMADQLVTIHGVRIAPFICYEIAYPKLIPKNIQTADMLLTISDDGWFGDSIAAWQHLESAQMASIVTHRPQLFVSNTGITAVINAQGQIVRRLKRNVTGVLR